MANLSPQENLELEISKYALNERLPDPLAQQEDARLTAENPQMCHFCFTQWNLTPRPEKIYAKYIGYMVYQIEICPDTGRHHYQGYFQTGLNSSGKAQRPRFITLQKLNPFKYVVADKKGNFVSCTSKTPGRQVSSGTWIRACRGSSNDNYNYCTKEETRAPGTNYFEIGEMRTVSRKTASTKPFDSKEANRQIALGKFDENETIDHKVHSIKSDRFIYIAKRKLLEALAESRRDEISRTKIFILYGSPGTSKTYSARYGVYDDNDQFVKYDVENSDSYLIEDYSEKGYPWFGTYNGQRRLVVDELEKTPIYEKRRLDFIIRICDTVTANFPRKHDPDGVPRAWYEVFITTNMHPKDIFDHPRFDCLKRRLRGRIILMNKVYRQQDDEAAAMSWDELAMEHANRATHSSPKVKESRTSITCFPSHNTNCEEASSEETPKNCDKNIITKPTPNSLPKQRFVFMRSRIFVNDEKMPRAVENAPSNYPTDDDEE